LKTGKGRRADPWDRELLALDGRLESALNNNHLIMAAGKTEIAAKRATDSPQVDFLQVLFSVGNERW
jgi:hypothetical protein